MAVLGFKHISLCVLTLGTKNFCS